MNKRISDIDLKIKNNINSLIIILILLGATSIQAYEIQIAQSPSHDETQKTFAIMPKPKEGEFLILWLGGEENIKKILIYKPFMNKFELTEEYVRNRFKKAVCINSRKDAWHYAPLSGGIIYFSNGEKIKFEMYLSGMTVAENFFY